MKISIVSYLNASPLLYGIQHAEKMKDYQLYLDIPAIGAKRFLNRDVDLALVPVGAMIEHPVSWVGAYCIGAISEVRTVVLLSDFPLESIKKVRLDPHSRTSVILIDVLKKKHFFTDWTYSAALTEEDLLPQADYEACLMIGDKVFANESRFKYKFDLAAEWILMTGLPFVFAAWASHSQLDRSFANELDRAQEMGVKAIPEVAEIYGQQKRYSGVDVLEYLQKNISYPFDEQKQRGLDLFVRYAREITRNWS